jgi:hypothetical protein
MTNENKGGFRRGAGRPNKVHTEPMSLDERMQFVKPHVKAIMDKLAEKAKQGDLKSIELFLAYAYGKPTERQEIADTRAKPKAVFSQAELADKLASFASEAAERAAAEKTKAPKAVEPLAVDDGETTVVYLDGTSG